MTPLTAVLLVAALALPGAATDPVGVWPLQPEPVVVHAFDPPDSPYGAGHRGVDLLGSVGQPVLAALPGMVTFAGLLAGRGVVVVNHGATRTTYEPVSATVTVGTPVPAGSQVGTLELAGSHCFPRACLPCPYYIRTGAAACAGFMLRAAAYFATHGITRIERVITDIHWSYRTQRRQR